MEKSRLLFSENPEEDLWKELLVFSYSSNVQRYLSEGRRSSDGERINHITSAFIQASEYFRLAKNASIQVSPLLLYYGSSNLLFGMTALTSNDIPQIKNHGMRIEAAAPSENIAMTRVLFSNAANGAVHIFAKQLGFKDSLTNYCDWILHDFIDSIAEIRDDYERCYKDHLSKTVLLDELQTPDGIVQRAYYDETNKEHIQNILNNVEGLTSSYLYPQEGFDKESQKRFFILRRKLCGDDLCNYSYSGQPYLRAGHTKKRKLVTLSTIMNMYISLYILATLCRYHPSRWSPFVQEDKSGERLLIERLLFYSRRMIPNFVLNNIVNENIQYSATKYEPKNTIKPVGEHEIKEIVDSRLRHTLSQMSISNQH